MSDQSRIVVAKEQISCDLSGEAAILNLKNGVYYGLDPVGARVWNLIRQPKSFAELREALVAEFEVEPERLEADLHDLIAKLGDQGLVEVSP